LLKRAIVLLAPLAAVGALALLPVSAHANYVCTGGTSPICEYVCKVPRVVGRTLKKAETLLRAHNCRKGEVLKPKHKKHPKGEKLVVTAQAPAAGGVYVVNQKVGVRVKYKALHHKKHKK
jgi:hypothetical protein